MRYTVNFYRGAVLWNSLPSIVSEAATVPSHLKIYILILIDFFGFAVVCFLFCVCVLL